MNIEQSLGLEPEGVTVRRLEALWPQWAQADPRIGATSFADLRDFQRHGRTDEVRALIDALASMAAVDGEDNPDAASALAFVLIPGAVGVACDLREWAKSSRSVPLEDREHLDGLVAAELWRIIREFPIQRLDNIVGNVLARTKYACRLQLGDREQLRRAHSIWSQTYLLDDPDEMEQLLYLSADDEVPVATLRVRETVATAISAGLIERAEADRLLEIAERVGDFGYNFVRGAGGLTGHRVAAEFADAEGISTPTMRRRIQRTLRVLRAHGDGMDDAA